MLAGYNQAYACLHPGYQAPDDLGLDSQHEGIHMLGHALLASAVVGQD